MKRYGARKVKAVVDKLMEFMFFSVVCCLSLMLVLYLIKKGLCILWYMCMSLFV